jgi:hypothetical protein
MVMSPSSIWGTSLSLNWDFEAEERVERREGDQVGFLAKVVEACEKGADLSFGSLSSAVGYSNVAFVVSSPTLSYPRRLTVVS